MILWSWMIFFNHITNFHKGCPMWLFKVLLPSLVFVICTSPVSWNSLILPATAAVKTCFSCKKKRRKKRNQNLGSSIRASRPFYFLQFQALTFRRFSCPNTFLFDLPSCLFIAEDTVSFQNHFLKNYGRMPRSSRLLNCFWILCGRFQAINIFGKALLTVSMLAMLWFQFLRHLVEWIFHSIWSVGRFYRSPFADYLEAFPVYSQVFGSQRSIQMIYQLNLGSEPHTSGLSSVLLK